MLAELAGLSDARILAACAVVLLYLASTAYFLWPRSAIHRQRANAADGETAGEDNAATVIAFASQTGFAAELASRTARSFEAAGSSVRLASVAELSEPTLRDARQALFIVSTTGEGDAPDPAASFVRNLLESTLTLAHLRYAVLALGDREYANFCAFGHRVDRWLRHQGAVPLFDVVEVDNGDEGALRHWQHQLSVVSNNPDLPDWEAPRYERWQLAARRLLNPGSAGDPCFHIELQPPTGSKTQWNAGDIAEIDPRNSTWGPAQHLLPHREYSIASLPADGAIHLLVRQMQRPEGDLGLGSGWLTAHALLGDEIAVRIRANANFHPPADERPLILVGNGTGIAGLRALLKARIAAGHNRNWLVFGERNAAHDCFYAEDLERWRTQGAIEQLDLVFSRDQPQRLYVQQQLLERAETVRQWVDDGAAIYVCGSLQGMAPGVDAALGDILGKERLEALAAAGRYRRDVY